MIISHLALFSPSFFSMLAAGIQARRQQPSLQIQPEGYDVSNRTVSAEAKHIVSAEAKKDSTGCFLTVHLPPHHFSF